MEVQINQINNRKLEFTGNWFIDAGIIGFVNLMEEVFGLDLEKLNDQMKNNEKVIYFGLFPIAYVIHNLKIKEKGPLENIVSNLLELNNADESEIFEEAWRFIENISEDPWIVKNISNLEKLLKKCENKEEIKNKVKNITSLLNEINNKHKDELKKLLPKNKKVNIRDLENLTQLIQTNNGISEEFVQTVKKAKEKSDELKAILSKEWKNKNIDDSFFRLPLIDRFFTNFLIFQTARGYSLKKQKQDFFNLISFNIEERPILTILDRTTNKFLPSSQEFSNIFYTKSPISTKEIKLHIPYLYVYILCFTNAFNKIDKKYYFFYSPDLKFTLNVNRKIYVNLQKVRSKRTDTIIKITWRSIIDTLTEYKSVWSIENMYIISHGGIKRETQEPVNVEYIGIPKLQASIILDDTIRENLNKSIKYRIIKNPKYQSKQYSWLLEEFIKGRPSYPIILNHVYLFLNEKERIFLEWSPSFYSLIIEANLVKFKKEKEEKSNHIFSENYFDNYKYLINKIKNDIRITSFAASLINQISEDIDKRKRIARELLNALKAKDKNMFLNTLLKNMNEKKELCVNNNLNNWIFNKIIKNDESFIMYGLILIMNLLRS
ncbi:MAG: hypothetical protein QXS37_04820 [Candidatus Aenigmatarchaeota archaeon]